LGGALSAIIVRLRFIISAAPSPCTKRSAIRSEGLAEKPQRSMATVKTAKPRVNSLTLP
jgi:hypothetical protein